MAVLDGSAFAMMSALRDQIEARIAMSEDFRALVALTRELSAYQASKGRGAQAQRNDARVLPRIVYPDRA